MSVMSWGMGTEGQTGHYFVPGGTGSTFTVPKPAIVQTLKGQNVVQIASGSNHNAALTDEGRVYTWGKNDCGQLGHGEGYENIGLVPELVTGLESVKIKQVSCGHFHTAALSEDGELYTWGWGGSFFQGAGALGHGDKTTRHEPEVVQALLDDELSVEEVQCGKAHTLLRTNDGEVWSFGKGEYGRLGNGSSSDLLLPEPVDLLLDIGKCTRIACGSSFSLALMENGTLYAWGRNEQGQCGVGGSMSMDVYSMEDYPMEVKGELEGQRVVDIGAGYGQALATVETGELYQWGMGQWLSPRIVLFEDGETKKIDSLSCGEKFNAVSTADGDVYTWSKGFFQKKMLGHEDQRTQKFPAKIEGMPSSNVRSISCGQKHTIALS